MKRVILVVDDEEIILNLLTEFFNDLDYEVIAATNGEDGLKAVIENPDISLVLTDVKMTGMSGIDLLKMIREYRTDLPVVIITGFKTIENAVAAVKYGAIDYISKPFDLKSVKKVIENIFSSLEKDSYSTNIKKYLLEQYFKYEFKTIDIKPEIIARNLAQTILETKVCTPTEYNQFYIAFTEVLINAVEHGNLGLESKVKSDDFNEEKFQEIKKERLQNKKYADKKVILELKICRDNFELTVEDSGNGFDYKSILENVDDPIASLEAFGRGFMYLNHLMDKFKFNKKGNKVTLFKSFTQEG